MRKGWIVLLATVLVAAFALPAMADVSFFGTARVIPTYYSNFDFDSSAPDKAALNEGGWASGEHIRSELRLGWKAGGDKWKINMIAESDVLWDKNNTDRSFYAANDSSGNYPQGYGVPNAGGEFGIERAEFVYTFSPMFELQAGWPISAVDIGSGGLLYGDDHPEITLRGKLAENTIYALTYLSIQNLNRVNFASSTLTNDWRAYYLKLSQTIGVGNAKVTVSPIVLLSDNRQRNASVRYYGVEALGQAGIFKPSFEFIYADGEIRANGGNPERDIKSYAGFAAVEATVSKAFNPYVAVRYTKGDNDGADNKVEGFVGITDIGRFTPLMGMDGNILGEHLSSGASPYNSPLYSYSPDRDGTGDIYGGIGNASSGNNPGQKLIALGAKGSLDDFIKNFSYKTQVFLIWFDKVGQIPVGTGKTVPTVDKYAGTTFDLQLKYDFGKNFAASYIFSAFLPGDGIKDQLATTANDTFASVNSLNLQWTY